MEHLPKECSSAAATELVVRESYGRLVAYLATEWGDLLAAEDALSEALLAALNQWPTAGIPDKPEAWLLTVAKRRLIDLARHHKVQENALVTLQTAAELAQGDSIESAAIFPDERLRLLFLCAHPAINPAVRTPLMLQAVLGLNATKIGSAFLIAPTTMGQRLVRAKTKIRDANISFDMPESAELYNRLEVVLEAIYAAYQTGWDDVMGGDNPKGGLAQEAVWLGRVLLELMPNEPEVKGLLALMLYCEARQPARQVNGGYVPLYQQDVALWEIALVDEAEQLLHQASASKQFGRFQLEAAIQSAHANAILTSTPQWMAIAQLYTGLVRQFPTVGALVGQAAAQANAFNAQTGLTVLDAIPTKEIVTYQPYWALRAHLLTQLGRTSEAKHAYDLAIGLAEGATVRKFLQQRATAFDPNAV